MIEQRNQDSNPIRDAITQAIGQNPVLLFMKGTPEAPGCGFSARTVAALQALGAPFAAAAPAKADQALSFHAGPFVSNARRKPNVATGHAHNRVRSESNGWLKMQ